jgi:hypothetical protein
LPARIATGGTENAIHKGVLGMTASGSGGGISCGSLMVKSWQRRNGFELFVKFPDSGINRTPIKLGRSHNNSM